jgi:hypothetical protein
MQGETVKFTMKIALFYVSLIKKTSKDLLKIQNHYFNCL